MLPAFPPWTEKLHLRVAQRQLTCEVAAGVMAAGALPQAGTAHPECAGATVAYGLHGELLGSWGVRCWFPVGARVGQEVRGVGQQGCCAHLDDHVLCAGPLADVGQTPQ